ncbi:glycosyltransferase family 2 protein [Lacinutrix sp. Bg11-31]|uniref:glycosyltransferase n=1 Tax=Lacinutrix sp. Bg11-31 TaxID=2057808 RepID=UPI000C30B27E|nr:glycosyltransferase family 2 protein [Lacinutrix sp. Bg11-31]AUC83393.1 glycosyl transferase family 2 [Lacinutrix sp. Bg11-31]
MNIYIIIPAHNEEDCIALMLESLANQTLLPKKVVVVNDNSTDNTQIIIDKFSAENNWLQSVSIKSSIEHIPGSKVINAFYKGFETLDDNYDIICKFDADIMLPKNYLESIVALFQSNKKTGIAGGLAYIEKNGEWIYETVASKNHVRGPFKAYRKECFQDISGLKKSIGWDTVDILLAQYYGWTVKTDQALQVKHLKPTGNSYSKKSALLQGEAFYKMRYGVLISLIATLKKSINNRDFSILVNDLKGYFKAKRNEKEFIVSEAEGKFIRKLRWKGIKQAIFG